MSLIAFAFLAGALIGVAASLGALRRAIARQTADRLTTWQEEQVARRIESSLRHSRAVLQGQMFEHLVPLFDVATFGHMADARFLGKPVDFLMFDGYSEVKAGAIDQLREIVFIDVKTGKSRLTAVERCVKECVEEGRVRMVVVDRTSVGPT